MTTTTAVKLRRGSAFTTMGMLLLLMAGCLEKHWVWSPDGNRAAVIAKDGLHLCSPDGTLTPLLTPEVYEVAWLGDSQRLVLARGRRTSEWAPIARVLGRERAEAVAAQADVIWKKLETGGVWGVLTMELKDKNGQAMLKVFLRERYGDALRAKLNPGEWDEVKSRQIEISELLMARIVGDRIHPDTPLHEGVEKIEDIRVSPGGRAIAFTVDAAPDNDDECRLLLGRIDATGVTTVVEHTSTSSDWTADGRSLVYVQAAGGAQDDLRLGTLVRREVLDENGQVKIAEKPEELAGLFFQSSSRVRCLRDGRILFSAVEFSLPAAMKDADVEREKLFALDPARQVALVRMIPRGEEEKVPKHLTFFEVSPDEKQVLVGGYEGEISVLTLQTGDVEVLQKAGDYNLMGAPVWRNSQEVTFARRNPTEDGKKPARKAEIVLRKVVLQKGDQEKVLSQGWSNEMLESVFSGSDKK